MRHADVLEFVWLLNSHPEVTYTWMHGDKDTYRLGFHLANKSADFAQVCCATMECVRTKREKELGCLLGVVYNESQGVLDALGNAYCTYISAKHHGIVYCLPSTCGQPILPVYCLLVSCCVPVDTSLLLTVVPYWC